jgi:hypothetical protein
MTDFLGEDGDKEKINYFIKEFEVASGATSQKEKCICKKVMGFGDLMPL